MTGKRGRKRKAIGRRESKAASRRLDAINDKLEYRVCGGCRATMYTYSTVTHCINCKSDAAAIANRIAKHQKRVQAKKQQGESN